MVSSEEVTEPVSTHKATGGKLVTNTLMETKEKTENQTEAQINDIKDIAVGKK